MAPPDVERGSRLTRRGRPPRRPEAIWAAAGPWVDSPSPLRRAPTRGCSAVGSAPPWHGGGQGFESPQLHRVTDRTGRVTRPVLSPLGGRVLGTGLLLCGRGPVSPSPVRWRGVPHAVRCRGCGVRRHRRVLPAHVLPRPGGETAPRADPGGRRGLGAAAARWCPREGDAPARLHTASRAATPGSRRRLARAGRLIGRVRAERLRGLLALRPIRWAARPRTRDNG